MTYRLNSKRRWSKLAAMLAAGVVAVLFSAAAGSAQPPGGMAPGGMAPGGMMPGGMMPGGQAPGGASPGQPSAAAPDMSAAWLQSPDGGMPWQIGAMFTAYWVLAAAEIAVISKPSNRLDRPKKKEDALVAD